MEARERPQRLRLSALYIEAPPSILGLRSVVIRPRVALSERDDTKPHTWAVLSSYPDAVVSLAESDLVVCVCVCVCVF